MSIHGTLTAEQVMAIAGKHQPDYCSDTHVCFDWQEIADELTAELERETLSACNSCAERIDLQAKLDELERENAVLSDREFYMRCCVVDMEGNVIG